MREGEYRGMRAWFAHIPDVLTGKRDDCANILLVNGERRLKTRLPESGTYRMESVPDINFSAGPVNAFTEMDTFVCAEGHIQDWHDLQNVEVVVLHYWQEERLRMWTKGLQSSVPQNTHGPNGAFCREGLSFFERSHPKQVMDIGQFVFYNNSGSFR